MFALFEDSGKFHAGRVMAQTDAALQVELDSGKRVKVKAAQALLRFEQPAPAELLADAQRLAAEVDLDLAWEFAPEGDFEFATLAREYFDPRAGAPQHAAMLLALYAAPHYFRRLGRGQFRKAPAETVQAALAAIERKKQQAAQIAAWAAELAAGSCPEPIREQIYKILFKPDKNAPETKAVVEAARATQRSPLDLLAAAGAIASAYQFHWRRFLYENFPAGTGFAPAAAPLPAELPRASCAAFSIDDSATTEIDDALSVQGLGSGTVRLGIHIAAPGLAFDAEAALGRLAATRLSTVYMPGHKITMLPPAVVEAYTLAAGRDCPAVSLYVTIDEATLEPRAFETRLETVPIAANLRHDRLDAEISEASLLGEAPAGYAFAAELGFGFRLARRLKAAREAVRGKPEVFSRPEYGFKLEGGDGGEPRGDETVAIVARQRGAPLDLIVSEIMILANSHWGGWLASLGVPAIYRSQASLAPGVKVRMGIRPQSHAGIGVAQYAWATSPLRRYVDLVNQWQIVACARHGAAAALAAPFKPRDARLYAIISAFDAAYAAYNGFQSAIERYWALRYVEQNGLRELDATVIKEGLVRADRLPLVFRVAGAESLARGAHLRARVAGIDLLALDLHATLAARLEAVPAAPGADDEADDEAERAGPLKLAIDLAEPSSEGEAALDAAAP